MSIGERSDYKTVIEQGKKTRWNWQHSIMVVSVHFSTEHKELLNQSFYYIMDICLSILALQRLLLHYVLLLLVNTA